MQESSISEKIKELRTDLKMNQKNFSAAIGIRQSTLSSYENGVVTPSNDVLLLRNFMSHWTGYLDYLKIKYRFLLSAIFFGFYCR